MTHRPLLALVLAILLVLGGCSQTTPKTVQAAIPAPSPSPTQPALQPVEGAVTVRVLDASRQDKLGFADDGPPPAGSVEAAAAAVAAALDQYLGLAQQDAADLAVLRAVWLEEASPAAADVLRQGLTTREDPVRSATYDMVIQVEPAPTLATTTATIERVSGSTVEVQLVFDLTDGDQPRLQLVGAGESA